LKPDRFTKTIGKSRQHSPDHSSKSQNQETTKAGVELLSLSIHRDGHIGDHTHIENTGPRWYQHDMVYSLASLGRLYRLSHGFDHGLSLHLRKQGKPRAGPEAVGARLFLDSTCKTEKGEKRGR
jgi:hypothetical protein